RLPLGPAHRRPGAERLRCGPGRPGVLIGVKSRNAAAWAWFAGAAAFLVAAVLLGVAAGYASITPGQIAGTLVAKAVPGMEPPLNDRQLAVLVELRLPRVVLGAMVGALLSVAGAAYQGVFRNPLADPYLLGAAGGAGLGATLVMAFGAAWFDGPRAMVPVAAFTGALLGVAAAYLLGRSAGRNGIASLVLAGVAVSSFLSAVQTLVQQMRIDELQRIYAWLLGGAAAYLLGRSAGRNGIASLVLAGVAVSSFLSAVQTLVQQMRIDELQRIYAWLLGGLAKGGWEDVAMVAPYAILGTAVMLV